MRAPTLAGTGARAGTSQGATVSRVRPRSPAALAGLAPGDIITSANDKQIDDFLDFYVESFAADLSLTVLRTGAEITLRMKRQAGQDFGAEIDVGKPMLCTNKCVFCFVDQMPRGLRENLYIKDEDYRHSFIHGNYLTLTDLRPEDEERIARMNLRPLYVSVHATDDRVRSRLLGRKIEEDILSVMDRLGDAGTEFHTQVVVIPGINDGEILGRTLADLCKRHTYVRSISVVPVGLTCHRDGLYPIRPVSSSQAGEIVDLVDASRLKMLDMTGAGVVYASDELFVLSGRKIPQDSYYDGYPQLDNGVGLLRTFLDSMQGLRLPRSLRGKRVKFVTGVLAASHIEEIAAGLRRKGLQVEMVAVENRLFGPTVTVSGLLSGRALLQAVSQEDSCDAIVLPPNILNPDGLTLDDMTIPLMNGKIGAPVIVGDYDLKQTISRLRDALRKRT